MSVRTFLAAESTAGERAPRGDAPSELVAEGVTVRFGGLTALENVTFALPERKILGLIGPNGSGKTTLLNVLTGFIRPAEGRIILNGQDSSGWSTERLVKNGVARTFQGARVFGRLSVRENIQVGAVGQRGTSMQTARERADQIIETYNLGAYAEHIASTLPAGVRRRVAIARALASEPRLILLDEPAAGLNESERADLVKWVGELRKSSGIGVGIVEHSMPVIMELCDEIQVLDGGRTLTIGTPAAVRDNAEVRAAYLGVS